MENNKLYKIIREEIENVLNEGIDFDYDSMTVSYNPSHEKNVDTSIENNPTKDETIFPNITVWSIFKRKRGLRHDGNPLLYALKGERDWTFRSEEDRIAIEQQFDAIAEKFASLYPIGVTILIPSGNELNKHIADIVISKSENAELIDGAICKLTTEDIDYIVLAKDSYFRKVYKNNFLEAYSELWSYLEEMNKKRDGYFSRHFVNNNKMRDILLNTLKLSPSGYAKYSKMINGQDVLLIDDTISRGQTIKEACQIMMESYAPKSITVLTLLSKLEN